MAMKIDEILKEIENLARSQGHWGRLLRDLREIQEEDPDKWEEYKDMLEAEEFMTPLDLILYFEEGESIWKTTLSIWKKDAIYCKGIETLEELKSEVETILLNENKETLLLKYINEVNDLVDILENLGYTINKDKEKKERK